MWEHGRNRGYIGSSPDAAPATPHSSLDREMVRLPTLEKTNQGDDIDNGDVETIRAAHNVLPTANFTERDTDRPKHFDFGIDKENHMKDQRWA